MPREVADSLNQGEAVRLSGWAALFSPQTALHDDKAISKDLREILDSSLFTGFVRNEWACGLLPWSFQRERLTLISANSSEDVKEFELKDHFQASHRNRQMRKAVAKVRSSRKQHQVCVILLE